METVGIYFDDAISMIGEVKRLFDISSVSTIIKKPDGSSSGSFRLHGDVPVQISHISTDVSNLSLDDNDNNGARLVTSLLPFMTTLMHISFIKLALIL